MRLAATALASLFLAAPVIAAPLAGVADEETTIVRPVVQALPGHGDVIFVRDASERWYRVQLNRGCGDRLDRFFSVSFDTDRATGVVDLFSRVHFSDDNRVCGVASIRRSVPPPQVDSQSPVTLD